MSPEEIHVGRVYAASKPKADIEGIFNDRQVIWMSLDCAYVQYDSPTISNGRHYPKTTLEKFAKWAGADVTEVTPKGKWRTKVGSKG